MTQPTNFRSEAQLLAGQVALVTGSGRGLGRAYAFALAKAGATVAMVSRTEREIQAVQQEIKQIGGQALAISADVSDKNAVAKLVTMIEQHLGPIDLLVNNAGVLRAIGRVTDIDADDWWHEIEVNLRGTFLCSQAVLPGMITHKHGRIINIASVGGLFAVDCFSAYCTSKAALIRFSECLAIENKEYGISVFAIHPGNVRTSMTEYLHDSEIVGQRAPWMQQDWRKRFAESTDTPIESSVTLVLQLAAGQADALSGRYVDAEDNLTELLDHADQIRRKDLYTLRLQNLSEI